MTRAQTALKYATLFLAAFTALEVIIGPVLDIAEASRPSMSLVERSIIAAYLWIMRDLPFLLAPVVMAPLVVTLVWFVPRLRPTSFDPLDRERKHLLGWLCWLPIVAVVVLVGVGVNRVRDGIVPTGMWAWALMTGTWANAGALHRAFRVHSLRVSAGHTQISSAALAVAAAALMPLQALAFVLPVWVLWASRETGRPTSACS
jgi:hypothetical protein